MVTLDRHRCTPSSAVLTRLSFLLANASHSSAFIISSSGTTVSPPHLLVSRHAAAKVAMLEGTRWTLQLDVGPERGTWMPPQWGQSGARAAPKVRVQFLADGELKLTEEGPYDSRIVKWTGSGGWYLEGENKVQFWLSHAGLARDDVTLQPGKLWFAAPAWGQQLSKRGNLLIKQSKLGWLPFLPTLPGTTGSFLVGTFRSVVAQEGDPPLTA
mmetsp:Transcript_62451/g.103890  ORF Transcript_62451/g.103890 Transcript_62451/m.103890 type:complete len:213 (-) Transcript_62451:95-733(-)